MSELHPDSGFGVVPYEHNDKHWEIRLWDGQTGESHYVVADIRSRADAESICRSLNRERRK